jgi:hypothetical protein
MTTSAASHGGFFPAVVIHSLSDARAVLTVGRPVTLLSATGAVVYAGSGWWRALIERARAEHPDIPLYDILDCGDASGLALGALRIGQPRIRLDATAPGHEAVVAIAASLGGEVLTHRPEAIDMSHRNATRRLADWLQVRTAPGDSGDVVS